MWVVGKYVINADASKQIGAFLISCHRYACIYVKYTSAAEQILKQH